MGNDYLRWVGDRLMLSGGVLHRRSRANVDGPIHRAGSRAGLVDVVQMWPYDGRTGNEVEVTAAAKRRRSERLEVRTTPEDRALIDRAVEVSGTDLTDFVVANLTVSAHRVLADRSNFVLDAESQSAWERANRRAARDLPGLRALMQRPSPFVEE